MADAITLEQDVDEVLGSAPGARADGLDEGIAEASTEPEDDEDEGSEDEGDADDDEE